MSERERDRESRQEKKKKRISFQNYIIVEGIFIINNIEAHEMRLFQCVLFPLWQLAFDNIRTFPSSDFATKSVFVNEAQNSYNFLFAAHFSAKFIVPISI